MDSDGLLSGTCRLGLRGRPSTPINDALPFLGFVGWMTLCSVGVWISWDPPPEQVVLATYAYVVLTVGGGFLLLINELRAVPVKIVLFPGELRIGATRVPLGHLTGLDVVVHRDQKGDISHQLTVRTTDGDLEFQVHPHDVRVARDLARAIRAACAQLEGRGTPADVPAELRDLTRERSPEG